MRRSINFLLFFWIIFLASCQEKAKDAISEAPGDATFQSNQASLSTAQIEAIGLKTGKIEQRNLTNIIKANGYVDVPPQNKAAISPFISGYIRDIRFLIGDQVKRGQVMAVIESMEYLEKQQQYIELESRLEYLENEFHRQETLVKENAVSRKKFLQAQTDYRSALAVYNGLKEELRIYGADFEALRAGEVRAMLYIRSPIDGTVSDVYGVIGRHVDPEEEIFEILNPEHLHLELSVFEKDILKVQKDQKVIFSVPNMGGQSYFGTVFLVGQNLEEHQRYVKVHVHMDDVSTPCKVGMYVNASIVVEDILVDAVPMVAVVQQGNKEYVFKMVSSDQNRKVFERTEVITGIKDQDYVELKLFDGINPEDEIVTAGAFYLSNKFGLTGE